MEKEKITPEIIEDLFKIFTSTKYGEKLAHNIRYGRYKPQSMSNEEWRNLLGDDVNNLYHALVVYNITKEFISENNHLYNQQLSYDEKMTLLLAAIIHDWGEAVVGDISHGLKTETDENNEIKALHKIAKEITKSYRGGILTAQAIEPINAVVFDTSTKLGNIFKAIEHIGFFKTAMNAWEQSKKIKKIAPNLQWIVINTLYYLQQDIETSKKYAPLYNIIIKNKKNITDAFNSIPKSVFDQYPSEEEKQKKLKLYQEAKKYWQKHKNNF